MAENAQCLLVVCKSLRVICKVKQVSAVACESGPNTGGLARVQTLAGPSTSLRKELYPYCLVLAGPNK